MKILRNIFAPMIALMAILCLPSTITAQAQHFVIDSTQFATDSEISIVNLDILESMDSLEYIGDIEADSSQESSMSTISPTRRQQRQRIRRIVAR